MAQLPEKCLAALSVFDSILTSTPPATLKQIIRSAFSLGPTLSQLRSQVSVQTWEHAVVQQYQVGPWWYPASSSQHYVLQGYRTDLVVVPCVRLQVVCLGSKHMCTQQCSCEHSSADAVGLMWPASHQSS
jgi:hypothetical protein